MLTYKHRPGTWKYLLLIPTLLGCTLLTAGKADDEERIRTGDSVTYHGNTFAYRETDTMYFSPHAHQLLKALKFPNDYPRVAPAKIISQMNGAPVYRNEMLDDPAMFNGSDTAYFQELKNQLIAQAVPIPDSLAEIGLGDVVINKEGRIVFYNLYYRNISFKLMQQAGIWDYPRHPFPADEARITPIIDRLIKESLAWKPATIDGKPVNVTLSSNPFAGKNTSLYFRPMLPLLFKQDGMNVHPADISLHESGVDEHTGRKVYRIEHAKDAPWK